MARYRAVALTLVQLEQDGPPVRLRDLAAMTGLTTKTLARDIAYGHLHAFKRRDGTSSPYFVDRDVARHYLARMGFRVARSTVKADVIRLTAHRIAR